MAKTVLVVEDDKYMREVLVAKLGKEGFTVLEATDGSAGLDITAKKKPDLVVLDIILPVMNGFDYLEAKAKVAAIDSIPVIILSNLGQREDVERGMKLGAKDYLIKAHFTPNDLMEKVRVHIG
ncbi:MAG: response regulator [Candidatus Pacebacteria bacterium]|nr:response regulator [Candidatus Paceibacterota bacterium]